MKNSGVLLRTLIVLFMFQVGCGDENYQNTEINDSLTAIERGALYYADVCAQCHGAGGEGSSSFPSLTAPHIAAQSDGKLFMLISSGTGGLMPAFADTLSEDEIIDIIAFLRSIAQNDESHDE